MKILNNVRLANKCRVCGELLYNDNNILCKKCQHRIRNFKWLVHFFGVRVLKYPLDELEEQEDKDDDSGVVIAS